jgi:hypothetical protein
MMFQVSTSKRSLDYGMNKASLQPTNPRVQNSIRLDAYDCCVFPQQYALLLRRQSRFVRCQIVPEGLIDIVGCNEIT